MHNHNKQNNIGSLLASIFAMIFGIIWTLIAGKIFKFMVIFGILFIAIAIINIVKTIKNMTGKNNSNNINYNEETINALNEFEYETKDVIKTCSICHHKISSTDHYCKNCGYKLK